MIGPKRIYKPINLAKRLKFVYFCLSISLFAHTFNFVCSTNTVRSRQERERGRKKRTVFMMCLLCMILQYFISIHATMYNIKIHALKCSRNQRPFCLLYIGINFYPGFSLFVFFVCLIHLLSLIYKKIKRKSANNIVFNLFYFLLIFSVFDLYPF